MKPILKGALWLSGAALVSKLIGTLQKIPLQNWAGDAVFGYYNAAYPIYSMIVFLVSAGLPLAVSRMITLQSQRLDAGSSVGTAIWFFWRSRLLWFGTGSAVVLAMLSPLLEWLIGIPGIGWSIVALACALCLAPVVSGWRGSLQAAGQMSLSAGSQVIEQLVRVGFMVAILFWGLNASWDEAWLAAAVQMGSMVGLLVIVLLWVFPLGSIVHRGPEVVEPNGSAALTIGSFRQTIVAGSLGALAFPLIQLLDAVMLPSTMGIEAFGVFSRPFVILQLIIMLMLALLAAQTPAWVRRLASRDQQVMVEPLGLLLVVATPAMIGMWLLAAPMNVMFFESNHGGQTWVILSAMIVPAAIQLATAQILIWSDRTIWLIRWLVIGILLKCILNFWWVNGSEQPLEHAAWSWVIVYLVLAVGQWLAWRRIAGVVNWRPFALLLGQRSLIMAIGVYVIANGLAVTISIDRFGAMLVTLSGVMSGALIYAWLWRSMIREQIREKEEGDFR